MLQHPDTQVIVADPEVLTATVVERLTEVVDEVRVELAHGVKANLGEQARQVDETADGFIGTEEAGDDGHGANVPNQAGDKSAKAASPGPSLIFVFALRSLWSYDYPMRTPSALLLACLLALPTFAAEL